MAVYTEVSDADLARFFTKYDVGEPLSCKGIAEGVENSNYLVQAESNSFILTLYEKRVKRSDLPFFLGLMEHLAKRGFPCPIPIFGKDGKSLRELCGRPAALISFLPGMWPRRILPFHCREVGRAMALMHQAGDGFTLARPNDLSLQGWQTLIDATRDRADEVQKGLGQELDQEIAFLRSSWPRDLPRGIIHADMFPDNVFFRGENVSGVIDFYFACVDFLAYDLAVALNAWCFEKDSSFNITKARHIIAGYQSRRRLDEKETAALPILARGSALRFLLTRLYDWLNHPEGAFVRPKDPLEYFSKLRFHRGVNNPAQYGLKR
ncbi:MAG: homoserine kinase [Alphaproteobacteria bacterium]